MSTVSSSGLTPITNAMLAAIMKRLDAMDDKLKALYTLCEKVTSLEAPTEELGNQQVTLTEAIERHRARGAER
jgi:hypothetical protein